MAYGEVRDKGSSAPSFQKQNTSLHYWDLYYSGLHYESESALECSISQTHLTI